MRTAALYLLTAFFTISSLAPSHATAGDATGYSGVDVEAKNAGGGSVAVGMIVAWPSASQPSDADKWLECNGQPISASAYPELCAFA